MSVQTALTWMMFIGLFPLTFFWLRRAYLIGIKKNYTYVALKRGVPPTNPEKYAVFSLVTNFISGSIIAVVIILIVGYGLDYDTWTAIIGTTIWMMIFISFILARYAHIKERK